MSYSLIYKLDSTASLIHKDHITNCDEAVPVFLPCSNHCTQEEGYESFLCAVLSRSVMSNSLQPPMDCSRPGSCIHGDSPGKNTGVGYQALLQGIFQTQGPNPRLSPALAGGFFTTRTTSHTPKWTVLWPLSTYREIRFTSFVSLVFGQHLSCTLTTKIILSNKVICG